MAARAGADAIGLVFYGKSRRAVSAGQAREIVMALPPFVTPVGLFVDAAPDEIRAVLNIVPLALLQFHGEEGPDACRAYHLPYIKAIRLRQEDDLAERARCYGDAAAILADSYLEGVPGGTGRTLDWSRLPVRPVRPLILAGGLTPENVGTAVAQVRPWAVDVSGGVEAAPGVKDLAKIAAFIRGVNSVQRD